MNFYHTAKTWLSKNKIDLDRLYLKVINVSNNAQIKSPRKRLIIAIQNLDNYQIQTGLAAIDDLEKIAKAEPKFHWEIMVRLTNFVQKHAPYIAEDDRKGKRSPTVPIDIQAALTVIARRDGRKDPENEQLDLSHTNLTGANLCEAYLEKTNLYQANLCGANLCGANLSGAILTAANLKGANLSSANLKEAILSAANLEHANLSGANLHRANLYLAKLQGATLDDAILHQANLRESEFSSESP